ncbi:MAG TPA: 4-hydroxy-tetrahydrodipicolinate synthase [Tepidisphaeraceae bacterium]|jgi:4-hydroxy-tetrahydrodipicolinate synthase|nr:4-hydroxy-tetrahydrodipicolinate synthase [Tepidisphaeraceae bacterium]
MTIQGAMTAMITPFREGKVDEQRLREQVEFQIKNGIDALVPVGTTGESPTLDFKEHARVIELTVQYAAGRVPVIAGTGANATTEALELHQIAKRAGAPACLSVNPYYNKPTQEGLYRHFMTLADRVDLPIVLYNIPGRTGVTMSAQTVARLAKHRNIIAVKEATGDLNMTSEIHALCDIIIVSGDDSLTVPIMSVGGRGVISVLSNVIPSQIKTLTKLCASNQYDQASALHCKLFPLMRAMFLDGNPVGIKHAMKVAGLDSGELRLPLWEAGDATKKQIEHCMKDIGAPLPA